VHDRQAHAPLLARPQIRSYSRIMNNLVSIKRRLEDGILATGAFEMLSKEVREKGLRFRREASWERRSVSGKHGVRLQAPRSHDCETAHRELCSSAEMRCVCRCGRVWLNDRCFKMVGSSYSAAWGSEIGAQNLGFRGVCF
jgi:hypothetical protein